MAILKSINPQKADMVKQKESVDYITNASKRYRSEVQSIASGRNYLKAIRVNRFLHRKDRCKRCFKHFLVSLQCERPNNKSLIEKKEMELCNVLRGCNLYYMEFGFATLGAVHCNTNHMHFHVQIDTCNCLTGKQWGQSKNDLGELKAFVSSKLLEYGLDEEILCSVQEVSEEAMLLEEDGEYLFEHVHTMDGNFEYEVDFQSDKFLGINDGKWNNGTVEQLSQLDQKKVNANVYGQYYGKSRRTCWNLGENVKPEVGQMCLNLDWNVKPKVSQTCWSFHQIVKPKGSETYQSDTKSEKPKGREMCRIIDEAEKQKGREMCRIVDNTKPRELWRPV